MFIFWKLLLLTMIIVFIIDLSGVLDEMEAGLAKWLKVKSVRIPKPFSCSLCMAWWSGLVLIAVCQSFTLFWIAVVAVLAFLTPQIYNLLLVVRDGIDTLIELLGRLIYILRK